jgi:hypothetical protein
MSYFFARKGRFSAKISIIDVALVSFLILIVIIIYNIIFPFKSFKKLTDIPGEKWMIVEIVVSSDLEWMCKYISKGDQQKGLQDKIFAEVIDIYKNKEFNERLVVRLKILTTLEPGQYPVFGRHPVRIGEQIVFQADKYILSGYIAKIEENLK